MWLKWWVEDKVYYTCSLTDFVSIPVDTVRSWYSWSVATTSRTLRNIYWSSQVSNSFGPPAFALCLKVLYARALHLIQRVNRTAQTLWKNKRPLFDKQSNALNWSKIYNKTVQVDLTGLHNIVEPQHTQKTTKIQPKWYSSFLQPVPLNLSQSASRAEAENGDLHSRHSRYCKLPPSQTVCCIIQCEL